MSFRDIKPGDVVTRLIGGVMPMELTVTAVDERLIHCGPWTFDRETGAEVDEELGWGPEGTGSYLAKGDGR